MGRQRIAAFYFLYFCSVGIGLPYLPQVLRTSGLTAGQVGLVLAVTPACALVFPPLWGHFADRARAHGKILGLLVAGCALGTLGLALTHGFVPALVCAFGGAVFGGSISTLSDTLGMHAARAAGGSFSRVRLFGSLGFIVASTAFGFSVDTIDRRGLWVMFAIQAAAAAFALVALRGARTDSPVGPLPTFAAVRALALSKGVRGLLAACALHWVACAPYHGVYGAHVTAQGFTPSVVGASTSLGVISEVLVMLTWPRWAGRVRMPVLLAACFAISAVRWVLTAHAGAAGLVALGVAHGFTFGAFYVGAVEWMSAHAPPTLRASGQSLFVAATFGLGGVSGYLLSGWLWGLVGTPRLFELAGAFELIPLGLAIWLARMNGEPVRPQAA